MSLFAGARALLGRTFVSIRRFLPGAWINPLQPADGQSPTSYSRLLAPMLMTGRLGLPATTSDRSKVNSATRS